MKAAKERQPGQQEAGFTLVEVLISMTLMGMVFASAFGAFFLGTRMIEDAREELRAAQILQSEMEALRGYNWSALDDLPTLGPVTPRGELMQQYADDYDCYRSVLNIGATGTQKQVSIYVFWTNSQGHKTSRVATSIFTRNGLNDYYYRRI